MGRLSALDAVTLDAYGTLLELDRPVERLQVALRRHGVTRSDEDVRRAFLAENAYYAEHKLGARDAAGLARLRSRCARVFVEALGADVEFTDAFVGALSFRPLDGVPETLVRLRSCGLALAVVSNWDISLSDRLDDAGIRVDAVVASAEVGVAKPDARPLRTALDRLAVAPDRALHVGDTDEDEQAAAAAGMHFARAPLPAAVETWAT